MIPVPDAEGDQPVEMLGPAHRDAVLRALDRVVHDGIILLAPDGRTIDYVNEAARRLLQVPPESPDVLAALAPVLEKVEPGRLTRVEVGAGESLRPILVEVSLIEEDDCHTTLAILKDARAVEVLEEDIFLANRMRGLGQTVLALAHDLKAPINAVMLNLDVLRGSLADAADRLEIVDAIRDDLLRLQRSLQAVLVQAAPPSDARRRFDLRRLVREVVRLVQPLAEGRDVRLRLELGDSSVTIRGSRDRLRQALRGVIVNAVEASPRLGEVLIEIRRGRRGITLAVCDEGPGFPDTDPDRLCRLRYTTKPDGSGIGLFVTRAAVAAHGGTLRFRNRERRGAAVEIGFPEEEEAS